MKYLENIAQEKSLGDAIAMIGWISAKSASQILHYSSVSMCFLVLGSLHFAFERPPTDVCWNLRLLHHHATNWTSLLLHLFLRTEAKTQRGCSKRHGVDLPWYLRSRWAVKCSKPILAKSGPGSDLKTNIVSPDFAIQIGWSYQLKWFKPIQQTTSFTSQNTVVCASNWNGLPADIHVLPGSSGWQRFRTWNKKRQSCHCPSRFTSMFDLNLELSHWETCCRNQVAIDPSRNTFHKFCLYKYLQNADAFTPLSQNEISALNSAAVMPSSRR